MRFYQSSTPQYVSQFSPLPLDFMANQIKAREAADATAEDLINKVDELKLKPGNHTDPLVVDKYNQWLDSNKNTIAEKFHSGEIDSTDAGRALTKLQGIYQNDPVIRNIKTDAALSAATNTAIAQGKYKRGISSRGSLLGDMPQFQYIDPKNASEADYAQAHNYITPTNTHDEKNFAKQYAEIKPQVTNTINSIAPTIVNGMPFYKYGNRMVTKKELTKEIVKKLIKPFAEYESEYQNTPWTQYMKALYGKQGLDYTENNLVEDIANNYWGYESSIDDRTDLHYTGIPQSNDDGDSDGDGEPWGRPAPMPEKNVGFTIDNFYKTGLDTKGEGVTGIMSETLLGTPNKNQSVKPKQIYELPVLMQNVVKRYLNNSSKWKSSNVAKNPNKKYTADSLDLIYKEIEQTGTLDKYQPRQIKSQSTVFTYLPGSNTWKKLFGSVNQPTLRNLENSPLNTQWVDVETGKPYTVKQLIDLEEGNADIPITGIGEYSAANSMDMFLPESMQGTYAIKPLTITVNGKEYIAQSGKNPKFEDEIIHKIQNVIYEEDPDNLEKGTPINFTVGSKQGPINIKSRLKYDSENRTFKIVGDDGIPLEMINPSNGQPKQIEIDNANNVFRFLIQSIP
jgi:hypothetical protein